MTGMEQSPTLAEIYAQAKREEQDRSPVDWPTLGVAAGVLLTFATTTFAAVHGYLPLWLAGILNIAPLYCCQIVVHEATHGNVFRTSRGGELLNTALGHVFAGIVFWDYQTFRHLHMRHHRATNDPHLDGDYLPPGLSMPGRILRATLFLLHSFASAARQVLSRSTRVANRRSIILSWCLFYGLAVGLVFTAPLEALSLWIAPSIVATALIMLAHWSMHLPCTSGSQFQMTRMLQADGWRGRLLTWAYLFQNYHLVHHFFPFVPFHRMAHVARDMQPLFATEGAEVIDLSQGLLSPITLQHDR